eukprot:GSA25T00015696001.1
MSTSQVGTNITNNEFAHPPRLTSSTAYNIMRPTVWTDEAHMHGEIDERALRNEFEATLEASKKLLRELSHFRDTQRRKSNDISLQMYGKGTTNGRSVEILGDHHLHDEFGDGGRAVSHGPDLASSIANLHTDISNPHPAHHGALIFEGSQPEYSEHFGFARRDITLSDLASSTVDLGPLVRPQSLSSANTDVQEQQNLLGDGTGAGTTTSKKERRSKRLAPLLDTDGDDDLTLTLNKRARSAVLDESDVGADVLSWSHRVSQKLPEPLNEADHLIRKPLKVQLQEQLKPIDLHAIRKSHPELPRTTMEQIQRELDRKLQDQIALLELDQIRPDADLILGNSANLGGSKSTVEGGGAAEGINTPDLFDSYQASSSTASGRAEVTTHAAAADAKEDTSKKSRKVEPFEKHKHDSSKSKELKAELRSVRARLTKADVELTKARQKIEREQVFARVDREYLASRVKRESSQQLRTMQNEFELSLAQARENHAAQTQRLLLATTGIHVGGPIVRSAIQDTRRTQSQSRVSSPSSMMNSAAFFSPSRLSTTELVTSTSPSPPPQLHQGDLVGISPWASPAEYFANPGNGILDHLEVDQQRERDDEAIGPVRRSTKAITSDTINPTSSVAARASANTADPHPQLGALPQRRTSQMRSLPNSRAGSPNTMYYNNRGRTSAVQQAQIHADERHMTAVQIATHATRSYLTELESQYAVKSGLMQLSRSPSPVAYNELYGRRSSLNHSSTSPLQLQTNITHGGAVLNNLEAEVGIRDSVFVGFNGTGDSEQHYLNQHKAHVLPMALQLGDALKSHLRYFAERSAPHDDASTVFDDGDAGANSAREQLAQDLIALHSTGEGLLPRHMLALDPQNGRSSSPGYLHGEARGDDSRKASNGAKTDEAPRNPKSQKVGRPGQAEGEEAGSSPPPSIHRGSIALQALDVDDDVAAVPRQSQRPSSFFDRKRNSKNPGIKTTSPFLSQKNAVNKQHTFASSSSTSSSGRVGGPVRSYESKRMLKQIERKYEMLVQLHATKNAQNSKDVQVKLARGMAKALGQFQERIQRLKAEDVLIRSQSEVPFARERRIPDSRAQEDIRELFARGSASPKSKKRDIKNGASASGASRGRG